MGREPYILQFTRIANQVKVTACDPETGTEVTIFGPANTRQQELSRIAVSKLEYMLKKKQT